MSPEERIRLFGPVFVKYFDPETLGTINLELHHKNLEIARVIFWTAWQQIKLECFNQRIFIDHSEVEEICKRLISDRDVWEELLARDDDFALFHQLRIDEISQQRYSQANTATRQDINRESVIRMLIRQFLDKTSQKTIQLDRLEIYFFEEVKLLIQELSDEGLVTTFGELKSLIADEIPGLPAYLLDYTRHFEATLAQIKPMEIEPPELLLGLPEIEDINIPEETIAPLKLREPVVQPALIEQPTPMPKAPPTTPQIVLEPKEYIISQEGIDQAIHALLPHFNQMDFYKQVKELLEKIRLHCRNEHKLPQFLKIIFQLKGKYFKEYNREDKSELGRKIGFIYSALGLMEAKLSESIPFMSGALKIQVTAK